jgi:hypothetical protein
LRLAFKQQAGRNPWLALAHALRISILDELREGGK